MNKANETVDQGDIIALGAVSIETKGPGFDTEVIGEGDTPLTGISEE